MGFPPTSKPPTTSALEDAQPRALVERQRLAIVLDLEVHGVDAVSDGHEREPRHARPEGDDEKRRHFKAETPGVTGILMLLIGSAGLVFGAHLVNSTSGSFAPCAVCGLGGMFSVAAVVVVAHSYQSSE